jgi:hypothetical protein
MVVAIVSAVRTSWKFDGNEKDELYFWRNAMSNIWYSSEIVGTIIVQCIPVLRPLLRDMKTSMTSKRIADDADATKRRSKYVPFDLFLHPLLHALNMTNRTQNARRLRHNHRQQSDTQSTHLLHRQRHIQRRQER